MLAEKMVKKYDTVAISRMVNKIIIKTFYFISHQVIEDKRILRIKLFSHIWR